MASPLTVWSSTDDCGMYGLSTTYATARSTGSTKYMATNPDTYLGQRLFGTDYYCYEFFFSFNTSSVGAASTVTTATLSFYGLSDGSDTDFTIQARIYDWSPGGLTLADYRSGNPSDAGSADEYTKVASYDTTGGWSISSYNVFTSEADFLTNIDQDGTTYLFLCSSRHLAGDTPTGVERVEFYCADQTGTDQDPKLYVEYTEGATGYVGMVVKRKVQA